MPIKQIFEILLKTGYVEMISARSEVQGHSYDIELVCKYHQGEQSHNIEQCPKFRAEVQR